ERLRLPARSRAEDPRRVPLGELRGGYQQDLTRRCRFAQATPRLDVPGAAGPRRQPLQHLRDRGLSYHGLRPRRRRIGRHPAFGVERMRAGGFPSRNVLDDAMLIATVETSVPVMAFDEDALTGPLGLRLAGADERLGGDGRPLSSRQVVVADAERAVAVLFLD